VHHRVLEFVGHGHQGIQRIAARVQRDAAAAGVLTAERDPDSAELVHDQLDPAVEPQVVPDDRERILERVQPARFRFDVGIVHVSKYAVLGPSANIPGRPAGVTVAA
jgi:hypothetical protein